MKNLLLPICLLAVLAAVASGVLYFRAGHSRQLITQQLAQATAHTAGLESQITALTGQNTALQAQVAELDVNLGEARTKLTVTEARNVQVTRELAQLKNQLLVRDQNEQAFNREITDLKRELLTARESVASPESVAAYQTVIADLEQQLAQSAALAAAPTPTPTAVLTTNRSRNTAVVSVGPSSAFVVLNFGAAHGALPGQELQISRGTDLIARVLISDVRENHSIAQVRPDSLRGALHKGDLAVLTE